MKWDFIEIETGNGKGNFFEEYKKMEITKPFPHAVVDFLKKGSQYLDRIRSPESCTSLRLVKY